jgi:hypothetical protein
MHDAAAQRFKSCDRGARRQGPERGAKSFVPALVRVDRGDHCRIERMESVEFNAAVITQRRIDRDRARQSLDHQSLEPSLRNQIEQRRRGDQIDRPVERRFEIMIEIDRHRIDRDARGLCHFRRARQQAEIVVGEPPILHSGKPRRQRAQGRAGAAGEIDDADLIIAGERSRDRVKHRRVAPAEVVGFAQREPVGRKAGHAAASSAPANSFAQVRQLGSFCAA